jgi:hypothetical protein
LNKSDWKTTAELIGIAAIVASLLFVGMQLRQEQLIAQADGLGEQMATRVDARLGLNEYAEIIIKGNNGEDLSEAEEFVLRNLVEMEEERVLLAMLSSNTVGRNVRTTELRFAVFLYQNPALRAAWEQHYLDTSELVDPLRSSASLEASRLSGSIAFRNRIKSNLADLDARPN